MNIFINIVSIPSFYHADKLLTLIILIVIIFSLKIGIDAKRRGMNSLFWTILCIILPFIFIPAFYYYRKPLKDIEPQWVEVFSHTKHINIQIAQNVLFENEINSVIIDKKDTNYLFGEIQLLVNENDFEKARAIIEQHLNKTI